jgi:hypothetical protein
MNSAEFISFCLRKLFQTILNILFDVVLNTVKKTQRGELCYVSINQSGLQHQPIKEFKK